MRSGLPVVTLHRSGFQRQLSGFRVLVLANTALLGREQVAAVREFVRAGGGLICTHETSLYDEEGTRRPDFGLADVLGVHYRKVLPAAERSLRIAAPQHPVVATLANRRSAMTSRWSRSKPIRPRQSPILHDRKSASRRGPGHPGAPIWARSSGLPPRPMVCHAEPKPGARPSSGCLPPRSAWVAREPAPVEIRANATVGVTLFDQPNRRILHLVNYRRDTQFRSDEVGTIDQVAVRLGIPAGRHVERIHRLWDRAELPFQLAHGRATFDLDKLGEYEAVAVEFE